MVAKRHALRAFALITSPLLVLVPACEDGREAQDVRERRGDGSVPAATDPPNELPEWLVEVTPRPEGRLQGARVVSVKAELATRNREVRLSIDGVDVTAQAVVGHPSQDTDEVVTPDRLVYDPEEIEDPLVPLSPGVHVATVRLLEFPEGFESGESVEVGSFTWSFGVS